MAQATIPQLAEADNPPPGRARRRPRTSLSALATLAGWQLRQTGRLLALIGLGLLTAVVLVCAIPLYLQVSLSAGVRHALEADPQNLALSVHAQSQILQSEALSTIQDEISALVHTHLAAHTARTPDLSLQISALRASSTGFLLLVGTDTRQAAHHVRLLSGRLPATHSGDSIEVAMTAENQHFLGLLPGKTFSLPFPLLPAPATPTRLQFRLVGILAPPASSDVFWHGTALTPSIYAQGSSLIHLVPALASNSEILTALDRLSAPHLSGGIDDGTRFQIPVDLYWYYAFDFSHLDSNALPDLSTGLNAVLTTLSNNPIDEPFIVGTSASGPIAVLQDYSNRIAVLQLPTSALAFLIAGLVLLFVLLLIDVLIERQVEAIALLRSRGASRRQVFAALLGQSAGLSLLALVAGPLLAISGVIVLANMTLAASERAALNVITTTPLQVALQLSLRSLAIAGIAVLSACSAIWRVLRSNLLVLRQQSARPTQRPLWMRWRLDLLAALIALTGSGFSLYIASPGVLDVRTRTLVLPATALGGVLFLLLGGLLLLLRGLPMLLRRAEQLAARARGAAPLLAMTQIARSPRQPLRTILFFALAIAFALFTLLFSQTQVQRIADITDFQVGADFSGSLPQTLQGENWTFQQAFYRSIKGVTSATLGTTTVLDGGSDRSIPIALQAVDSSTYARTIIWPAQNSTLPESRVLATLSRAQATAISKNTLPAILDDAAAQALGIGRGQQFVLADFHGPTNFVAAAIVHLLPTVYDSATSTGADTSVPQGGVLVDFQAYSTVEMNTNQPDIAATQVWLRTNTSDLANVRSVVLHGTYELENGLDRRALAYNLETDPLYSALVGILLIGALIALLLGLGGSMLLAWWNVRRRRTTFALLRSLGCPPGQLARILLWEQGIVSTASLVLGAILGSVFAFTILPAFIFSPLTGVGSPAIFYIAQSLPPVQVVIPLLPVVALFTGLMVVCALALLLMLAVIVRPRLGQLLRVDNDS
jgi:putative ABC transport system permease protein